ncbi:hypothetical protein MMC30_000761 [Trapelia coarctata]|nr:hypothetical protein [Trapelia coarctata]
MSANMTPYQLPNTDNALHFLLAVATQPFPLIELPKRVRQKILEYVVAPTGFIGLQLDPWPHGVHDPAPFPKTRFTEDIIGLRSSCKQLYEETGEVLLGRNTIIVETLDSFNYLIRTLSPLSLAHLKAIIVTENAFYYAPNPTSSAMQSAHTSMIVNALLATPKLSCLTMTMPWDIQGPVFRLLVRSFAMSIPHLKELVIRRPYVENLLHPDLIAGQEEQPAAVGPRRGGPRRAVTFPTNMLEILRHDSMFVVGVNTEVGGRLEVRQTERVQELVRLMWSVDGRDWP